MARVQVEAVDFWRAKARGEELARATAELQLLGLQVAAARERLARTETACAEILTDLAARYPGLDARGQRVTFDDTALTIETADPPEVRR